MATTDKRAKALREIQLMLEKAKNNDSQAEVEMIMGRVARLMTRYMIEDGEITAPGQTQANTEMGSLVFTVDNMDNCGAARRQAVSLVADAFGGKCVYFARRNATGKGIYSHEIHIFATVTAIETLRILLPSLILQMGNCLGRDAAGHREQLRDWGYTGSALRAETDKYRRTYIRMFGFEVAKRIEAMRGAAIDETHGSGSGALVLLSESERAQKLLKQTHEKVRQGQPMRGFSEDGARDGRKAGASALIGQDEVGKDSGRTQLAA